MNLKVAPYTCIYRAVKRWARPSNSKRMPTVQLRWTVAFRVALATVKHPNQPIGYLLRYIRAQWPLSSINCPPAPLLIIRCPESMKITGRTWPRVTRFFLFSSFFHQCYSFLSISLSSIYFTDFSSWFLRFEDGRGV